MPPRDRRSPPPNGLPRAADLLLAEARSHHAAGRLADAARLYGAVLAEDRRHVGALTGLGILRLQEGALAEALALFEPAARQERNSAELHHHVAFALTGLGRLEEALASYRRALRLRPDFAEAHNNIGHALLGLGRDDEALGHFDRALGLRPAYREARNNRGNALQALGRLEEAAVAYRAALDLDPGDIDTRANFAAVLVAGRISPAALDPPLDGLTALMVATLAYAAGNHALAAAAFERAAAAGERDEAELGLGRIAAAEGFPAKAARRFEDMFARGVRSAGVLAELAALPPALVMVDIVPAIETALAASPDNPMLLFALGRALDGRGRPAEAWPAIRRANALRWAERGSDDAIDAARAARALGALQAPPPTPAAATPTDLFIFGASRSGKTTAETLLAGLPGFVPGGENRLVEDARSVARRRLGLAENAPLDPWPPRFPAAVRAAFRTLRERRAAPGPVLVTTTPGNIHHAALLAATLPSARFLLMRRDAADNALRIAMQDYEAGNAYAYDQAATDRHLRWQSAMTDALAAAFPDLCLVLDYEAMVADPHATRARVAAYCGVTVPDDAALVVPFDDRGCAEAYRSLMGEGEA